MGCREVPDNGIMHAATTMPATVRIDALRRASQWLGGIDALARALGVSPRQLETWLNGEEPVPTDMFLRAVDLIEERSQPDDCERRSPPEGNDTQHG